MLSIRTAASKRLLSYQPMATVTVLQTRMISGDETKKKGFRARRRPSPSYRPVKVGYKKRRDWLPNNDNKFVTLGEVENPQDELEEQYGPVGASIIKDMAREKQQFDLDKVEDELRLADYLIAETGSTEDLAGRRRLATSTFSEEEHAKFMKDMEEFMLEGEEELVHPDTVNFNPPKLKKHEQAALNMQNQIIDDTAEDLASEDPDLRLDPNQLVHGEWSEMLVTVGRTTKLWRGGRLESYRALVIGGNTSGCGGFGIGKSWDPALAVDVAGRNCKKNVFFVDRYQNDGITRDLVGKQNSCKIMIMANDNGLRGNELMREILKRFGITNASCKAFGNRNPFNVVRATFKALMTHESLEDIALKRGKRILSIDKAMRMQV